MDGNTVNDGGGVPGIDDWDDVFSATDNALRSVFVVDSAASDSTTFSGGIKDTQSLNKWTCTQAGVQDKSNILHAYGATYSDSGDLILYAGADREGNNGTANIGVWLFQEPVSCESTGGATPFVGTHIDGDLLLVAEFDQGGRVAQINVYRWSDPDLTPQSGDECLGGAIGDCSDAGVPAFTGLNCDDSNPGDFVCGRTNPVAPINSAWRAGIPTQGFYEAGANLTKLIPGDSGCFAQAIVETRSSTSLTATLKDFVSLDLSTCGTLTVAKDTENGNGDFTFSVTPDPGNPPGPFILADGESEMFGAVEADSYTISEGSLPTTPEWTLTDISCVGGSVSDGPNFISGGTDGGNVTVDIGLSDDVTCTFTNTFVPPAGEVTLFKTCDSADAGGQTFNFNLGGFGGSSTPDCADGSVTLACGGSVTCQGLAAGDYSVDEVDEDHPPEWNLTNVSCDVGSCDAANEPDWSFSLAGGGASATFTNTEDATIEICKETDPAATPGNFNFSGSLGDFILADGECEGPTAVTPDVQYDITESVHADFTLSNISCTGSNWSAISPTVSVTPDPGEAVQCTFTNTQDPGYVQICKTTVTNSGMNPVFTVNLLGPDGDLPQSTGLQNGECEFGPADGAPVSLTPGSGYSVTEDAVAGWEGSVSCIGSEGAEADDDIEVSPNETVVCTFTNTENARLTIVKRAQNSAGEFCFAFSSPNFGDGFCLEPPEDGTDEQVFDGLGVNDHGNWSVSEIGPEPPWVLSSATCDNGDSPSSIDVGPGDDITCTFVNEIPNDVPIPANNPLALLALLLGMFGLAWYFRPERVKNV